MQYRSIASRVTCVRARKAGLPGSTDELHAQGQHLRPPRACASQDRPFPAVPMQFDSGSCDRLVASPTKASYTYNLMMVMVIDAVLAQSPLLLHSQNPH